MTESSKEKYSHILEPVICDVVTPVRTESWSRQNQLHAGNASVSLEQANSVKELILVSAAYFKIILPYRFTLTSSEIIYANRRIESVRLAGSYLFGIDVSKVEAQISVWKTEPPPETFLDEDEIVMSKGFSQRTYFVAHRGDEEFYIAWNLGENYDVCRNPQNYSGIQWHTIDFTR